MDEPEEERGIEPEDREDIEADLEDLTSMRTVFEPQGVRGVVIACPDCGSNHFYEWELLQENLEYMLQTGEPRMHEPAYEPREDEYIQWDYGKGYVDALADAGLGMARVVEATSCPWCKAPFEDQFSFCPRCGRSLAPVRLYRDLLEKGMEDREVRALLIKAGFEPF